MRAVPPRARPERPLHTRLAPCLASLASHPSRLAEDAVKLAIKDYQSKQEERDAVVAERDGLREQLAAAGGTVAG